MLVNRSLPSDQALPILWPDIQREAGFPTLEPPDTDKLPIQLHSHNHNPSAISHQKLPTTDTILNDSFLQHQLIQLRSVFHLHQNWTDTAFIPHKIASIVADGNVTGCNFEGFYLLLWVYYVQVGLGAD